jgi:hypothetical protein
MAGIIDEVKKLPVAFLDVYHSTSAEEGFQLTRTILPIYPNEDFFFGRANDWYVHVLVWSCCTPLTSTANTNAVI